MKLKTKAFPKLHTHNEISKEPTIHKSRPHELNDYIVYESPVTTSLQLRCKKSI